MSDTFKSSIDQRGLLSLASWRDPEARGPGEGSLPPAQAGPSIADLLRRRGEAPAPLPAAPARIDPVDPEILPPHQNRRTLRDLFASPRRQAAAPSDEDTREIRRTSAIHSAAAEPAREDMPAPGAGKAKPKQARPQQGVMGRIAGLMRRKPKPNAVADAVVADATASHAPQPAWDAGYELSGSSISGTPAELTQWEPQPSEIWEAPVATSPGPVQPSSAYPPHIPDAQRPMPRPQSAPAQSAPPVTRPTHAYAPPATMPAPTPHGSMPHAPMPAHPAAPVFATSPVTPFPAAVPAFYPAMPGAMQHPSSAHFYWAHPVMQQPAYYPPPPSAGWPAPQPGAPSHAPVEAAQPQYASAPGIPARPSAANDPAAQSTQGEMPSRHDPLTAEIDAVREQLRAFGDSLRALHQTRASRRIG